MLEDQIIYLPLATAFDADHASRLTLSVWTGVNIDRETIHLGISGLRSVPEPASVLIATASAVGVYT